MSLTLTVSDTPPGWQKALFTLESEHLERIFCEFGQKGEVLVHCLSGLSLLDDSYDLRNEARCILANDMSIFIKVT